MTNNLKVNLGKNIQKFRKQRKMTQERLSELVGIDPKNISRIENGNNYPSPENLSAIALALNIEIYELFIFNEISYEFMRDEIYKSLDNKKNVLYLYNCLKS